jgi:hypothetical protein
MRRTVKPPRLMCYCYAVLSLEMVASSMHNSGSNQDYGQRIHQPSRCSKQQKCNPKGSLHATWHFVLGVDLHSSQVDLKHHGLGVAFMGLERLLANPNRSHNDTQLLQIAVGSALWPLFWTYICSIDELELCRRRIGSAVYVQTNLELWIGLLKPCRFDLSQQLTSGARSRVKRFAVQQLKS